MRSSLAPFLALAFTVQSPPEPDVAARVREWLRPAAEAGHLSGALLVARDDEILVEAAFGMANAEHRVLNRVDTRFAIASITKEMTFAATIRLAETGNGRGRLERTGVVAEFPRGDARRAGLARRYSLHTTGDTPGRPLADGVGVYDWASGRDRAFIFGPDHVPDEMVYVPKPGGVHEADAWLVGPTINLKAGVSELHDDASVGAALEQAIEAIGYATPARPVTQIGDIGLTRLLAHLDDEALLPRFVELEGEGADRVFVSMEHVIAANLDRLFPGMEIVDHAVFRVTRDADFEVSDEADDLQQAVQDELRRRRFGEVVRLEIAAGMNPKLREQLIEALRLEDREVYDVDGLIDLGDVDAIADVPGHADLRYSPWSPVTQPRLQGEDDDPVDIFAAIRRADILVHHPYDSFTSSVERFVEQAVSDPDVLAIKQTVYRTGTDSELMEILIEAAKRGKEVTVVVELMARFDEEANIGWASRLEEVGAHVVYGVVGHKTHAKMALVVRREDGAQGTVLKRYAHLSTGNYHLRTTKQYTDFGLLTAAEDICAEVNEVFKQLTGLGRSSRMKHLWLSPFTLHKRVVAAVRNEARIAKEGRPARLIAKMNALLEPELIEELYAASQAGVKIDLIVRGVCALRPGVQGLSENITVRSIVGRFLEHSRVFCFHADGADEVFLSSADWMDRNFFRRIELAFPVRDPALKARVIREGLQAYLDDPGQAWVMNADGAYEPPAARRGKPRVIQEELLRALAPAG